MNILKLIKEMVLMHVYKKQRKKTFPRIWDKENKFDTVITGL